MPYVREGKCVYKQNADGSKGELRGCSKSVEMAKKYMDALYAHEKQKSALAEMSMFIHKASREKKDGAMRLFMVNSDTGEDVFGEKMSLELFNDFVSRSDNNSPVPAPFDTVIEKTEKGYWNGGPPYLSIAHYKSGAGKNVPGHQEKLYIDGEKLKSIDVLDDTPLGNAVWKAIYNDLYEEDKAYENPVRVSIGFLDLEHMHEGAGEDGSDFVFTRSSLEDKCPMCAEGVGNKVYLKGHLVHKAFTRVPAHPRTDIEVDGMAEKSDGIVSKKDDAKSIVEDLVDELEEKSAYDDLLVTKADVNYREYAGKVEEAFYKQFSPPKQPVIYAKDVSSKSVTAVEYTNGEYDSMPKVYSVGYKEDGDGNFTFDKRSAWTEMQYGLMPKKSEADDNEWEVELMDDYEIEEAISKREDVSNADKKRATKKYGNVTYADPKNKKYPIDTEEHIRAAWNYIHQKRNAAKYPDGGAAVRNRIIAAWKAKIDKAGPPEVATKSKSEAIMDEQEVLENEPVLEDAEQVEEENIEQKPEVEVSQAEKSAHAVIAKIAELKKQGKYGDAALKELQPVFNQFGAVAKSELAAPFGHIDEDELAEKVAAKLMPAFSEMIAKSLAGLQIPAQANGDEFKTRSLTPAPVLPVTKPEGAKALTQIQKIARVTTGLPVE